MKSCQQYIEDNFKAPKSRDEIVDAEGKMKFEVFIKIYEVALAWNKVLFEE
jgi:hypothetical protein